MKAFKHKLGLASATDFKSALQHCRLYLQDCGLCDSTIEEYTGDVGRHLKFCGIQPR